MAFNKDELIIADVLSGVLLDKTTRNVKFLLNEITDPSLSLGEETVFATDRRGVNIARFVNSKSASLTGSNALFSLGLLAAQVGNDKKVASSSAKIRVPIKESITVGGTSAANTTINLKHTPIAGSISLAVLDDGGSLTGVNIPIASASSTTSASVSAKVVTLPTGLNLTPTSIIGAFYEYESENAVEVTDNARNAKSVSGIFRLEVLFCEKCNQDIQYFGFIEFPSAILSAEADIDLTTEGNHPFTIEAMADYCSPNRELFRIVVPGQED